MEYALRVLQSPTPRVNCDNFAPACLSDISSLSNVIIPLIYILAALLFLGVLILAAINIIRAQSDPAKIKKAQQTITFAILGIIVITLAFFLTRLAGDILDIDFLL